MDRLRSCRECSQIYAVAQLVALFVSQRDLFLNGARGPWRTSTDFQGSRAIYLRCTYRRPITNRKSALRQLSGFCRRPRNSGSLARFRGVIQWQVPADREGYRRLDHRDVEHDSGESEQASVSAAFQRKDVVVDEACNRDNAARCASLGEPRNVFLRAQCLRGS